MDPERLRDIEICLHKSLVNITNTSLSDERWLQAILPCRDGGLCIPSLMNVAVNAYLASVNSSTPLATRMFRALLLSHEDQACTLWRDLSPAEPSSNKASKQL